MAPQTMPTVAVYFLGGTISMSGGEHGASPRLDGAALLASVPGLAELDVRLDVHDPAAVPSAALTFADIGRVVADARRAAADGVVVVQGTDTIEESAYLVDLLWDRDAPVVITGAMRTPGAAGADGPANLLDAIRVAASPRFRAAGALVVFADEVHAARRVRKAHTTSVAAFVSPDTGPIGRVVEGVPVRLAAIARHSPVAAGSWTARVPVLAVGMDDGGELLEGVDGCCDGLVVAGVGAGHVPPALAEPLGALAASRPVVLASRAGAGPVLSRTYAAIGSERDLLARGLIGAGFLDPYKARTLLRVLIGAGCTDAEIAAQFATRGGVGATDRP